MNTKTEKIRTRVYFSPGEEPRNQILKLLGQAQSSVKICVFTISDDIIATAILACASRRIDVKIITDNDKSKDKGSDINALSKVANISVKVDNSSRHMHHKFAIVDEEYFLTGSYNWTRSAAEYNQENILISNHYGSLSRFDKEFETLWQKLKDYKPTK